MQQCFLIDPRKVNKLLQSLDTCWPTGEGTLEAPHPDGDFLLPDLHH
jgi:hypothetical protein